MNPGDVVIPAYQPLLVAASYVMSVLGCFAALHCATHIFREDGSVDRQMTVYAALALGGIGVWSMHFIGMLGYQVPMAVRYEGFWTLLSLIAAVAISGFGLLLAGWGGRFSYARWAVASIVVGIGACVMHYIGMNAIRMRASMAFDMNTVGISVAIAVAAAAAALWLAFNVQRASYKVIAALVMGLAVSAMHYTGMASASLLCTADIVGGGWIVSGEYVGLLAFGIGALILGRIAFIVSSRWVSVQQAQPASA